MSGRIYAAFLVLALCLTALLPADAQDAGFDHLQLPPLILSSASEQTTIVVTLEMSSGDKPAVQELSPRLLDAFRQKLHDMPASGATKMQGAMLDLWQIKVCLMAAVGDIAKPGLIRDMKVDVVQGRT